MMKPKKTNRELMLSYPDYWVEKLNGILYDAIVRYKEKNGLKQKDLAKEMGITPGRLSQILNSGDINFSYEKIVNIALAVGVYPVISLVNQEDFHAQENTTRAKRIASTSLKGKSEETYRADRKVIVLSEYKTKAQQSGRKLNLSTQGIFDNNWTYGREEA